MLNIVGRELWAVLSRSDSPRWYLRRHDCLFPYSLRLRYHLRNSLCEQHPASPPDSTSLLTSFVMNGEGVNGAWGFGLVLAHGA